MSRHKVRSSLWFQICPSIGVGFGFGFGVALYPAIMFPRSFNYVLEWFFDAASCEKDRCLQYLTMCVTENSYICVRGAYKMAKEASPRADNKPLNFARFCQHFIDTFFTPFINLDPHFTSFQGPELLTFFNHWSCCCKGLTLTVILARRVSLVDKPPQSRAGAGAIA